MKNLFCGGLKRLGLHFVEPQGAYYVLVDISEYHVKNDVKFCYWLAQHVGVGAVPGSSFFAEDVNNLIRLHFAKKDETLNKALENLAQLPAKADQYDESAYSDADIEG
jgi:aspartate/methionine/tyrosine aminotransferase